MQLDGTAGASFVLRQRAIQVLFQLPAPLRRQHVFDKQVTVAMEALHPLRDLTLGHRLICKIATHYRLLSFLHDGNFAGPRAVACP